MKGTSPSLVPNRFERRRERTRQDLLAAAVRVLAERGLHDTKITDIATAADVGVGTFYLHFPTKEALFDAVVDETLERLVATADGVREAAPDPVTRLRAGTVAFCRFAHENREVFQIVFGHGSGHHDVIRRAQARFAAEIESNLREGISARAFAPVDPALAAQAHVGMATQVLSWWTANQSVPLETVADTLTTLTLRGLQAAGPTKGD